jgi:hypothetical protein
METVGFPPDLGHEEVDSTEELILPPAQELPSMLWRKARFKMLSLVAQWGIKVVAEVTATLFISVIQDNPTTKHGMPI